MLTLKNASLITCLVLTGLVTTNALADKKSPEEKAIEYRQAAFTLVGHHFSAMGAMVKGDTPFDAEAFKANANTLKTLSEFPINGFIDGSYEGKTGAKSEIAANMADFKEKMETFKVEVSNLAKAAESGDMEVIKPQFGKTGQSCKACHDQYRQKD